MDWGKMVRLVGKKYMDRSLQMCERCEDAVSHVNAHQR